MHWITLTILRAGELINRALTDITLDILGYLVLQARILQKQLLYVKKLLSDFSQLAISIFAIIAEVHGFDISGKMLRHHLGMSGDPYRIPVDRDAF